jgi:hypothetical protein
MKRKWFRSRVNRLKLRLLSLQAAAVCLVVQCVVPGIAAPAASYSQWTRGPSTNANYFPIAVWLQSPKNAGRFKAAGINLYVGLWRGPTSEQLAELARADMAVICSQNSFALEQKTNRIIVGWMHGDEPDNAQSLGEGKGYGPPIKPEAIVRNFERMRSADPSRPILLNMGQGVAWDNYIGRGVRRNHPEDYPEYIQGCDIPSFDIYPAVHDHPDIAGKLEFVAHGVSRLREWSRGEKPVWNCIEAARISNTKVKPTPDQIRSEVWMSLIHGSQGIIYFVHQFQPTFKEASLLDDPELLPAVTALNHQIRELAPVLNSPTITDAVRVKPASPEIPVATMVKEHQGHTYLFAVAMRGESTSCTFSVPNTQKDLLIEGLGESRTLSAKKGEFTDTFGPYQVRLYRYKTKDL